MADPIIIPVGFDLSGLGGLASAVSAEVSKAGADVQHRLGGAFDAAGKTATKAMDNARKAVQAVRAPIKTVGEEVDNASKGFKGFAQIAGVAAVSVIAGIYGISAAADEALNNLREMGATDFVTPEQIDNVERLTGGVAGLTASVEVATVAVASALEPSITAATSRMSEMLLFTAKVAGAFDTGGLSINSYGALLASLVLGPIKMFLHAQDAVLSAVTGESEGRTALIKTFDDFAIGVADSAFAVNMETEAQRESLTVTLDAAKLTEKATEAKVKQSKAYVDHAKTVEKAEKEAADAEKKRVTEVLKLWDAAVDRDAAQRFEAEIAAHQRVLDLKKQYVAAVVQQRAEEQAAADDVARIAEEERIAAAEAEAAKTATDRWADALGDLPQLVALTGQAYDAVATGINDLLNVAIDNYAAQGEAGKKSAMDLWAVTQGVAVAQTVANGAVAVSQALAQLGPVAGPIAAAGIVASTIAGALATITSTVPEFDQGTGSASALPGTLSGGQQDQFLATLYRGEGVLTRQGVDNAGGPAAVRDLNNGTHQGGGPTQVSVVFRDRVVDRMMTSTVNSGGAMAALLDSIAGPPGIARVWR